MTTATAAITVAAVTCAALSPIPSSFEALWGLQDPQVRKVLQVSKVRQVPAAQQARRVPAAQRVQQARRVPAARRVQQAQQSRLHMGNKTKPFGKVKSGRILCSAAFFAHFTVFYVAQPTHILSCRCKSIFYLKIVKIQFEFILCRKTGIAQIAAFAFPFFQLLYFRHSLKSNNLPIRPLPS